MEFKDNTLQHSELRGLIPKGQKGPPALQHHQVAEQHPWRNLGTMEMLRDTASGHSGGVLGILMVFSTFNDYTITSAHVSFSVWPQIQSIRKHFSQHLPVDTPKPFLNVTPQMTTSQMTLTLPKRSVKIPKQTTFNICLWLGFSGINQECF